MSIDVRSVWAACAGLAFAGCCGGCRPLSKSASEPSAGLNGGFEVVREGLPVQWSVYSPETVPGAAFRIEFDEAERREGLQALRFDVAACGDEGGWRSPGIARELEVEPGATYAVSFQIKSESCRWSAAWGGVDAKTGELERTDTSPCEEGDWRLVEARYRVPERYERLHHVAVRDVALLLDAQVRVERRRVTDGIEDRHQRRIQRHRREASRTPSPSPTSK